MNKKYPWLPVDERLIPDIFSFDYPKSPWVRAGLFIEMLFAILAVIGTLILAILPKSSEVTRTEVNATTTSSPSSASTPK